MAPTGMSLLLRMSVLSLTARAVLASSATDCAVRFHGALIRTIGGDWDVEVEVENQGPRGALDYEKTAPCGSCGLGFGRNSASSVGNISLTDSDNMAATTDDQQAAAADLGALLDAGDGAVVTLVAGRTRLAAHRAVLVAGSPVFAARFAQNTLGASSSEVAVLDVEAPVLRQLVAFLYTGKPPQLPGMAPHLLAAAVKYGVADLKAASEQQLAEQLTVENAAATAVLAIAHSCHSLRKAAVRFIKAHLLEVIATKGWADAASYRHAYVVEVSRLLAELPAETGAPFTTESSAAHTAAPSTADSSAAPTAAPSTADISAAPTTTTPAPTPDAAAVSRYRSLSPEDRNKRLRQAAWDGAVEEVRALLASGADVEATDGGKWTALHDAAYSGDAAVVRLLLAASADPNARSGSRRTPLHVAAYWGRAEAVAALLEGGADRGLLNISRDTALDLARQQGRQQVVQLLQLTPQQADN